MSSMDDQEKLIIELRAENEALKLRNKHFWKIIQELRLEIKSLTLWPE